MDTVEDDKVQNQFYKRSMHIKGNDISLKNFRQNFCIHDRIIYFLPIIFISLSNPYNDSELHKILLQYRYTRTKKPRVLLDRQTELKLYWKRVLNKNIMNVGGLVRVKIMKSSKVLIVITSQM